MSARERSVEGLHCCVLAAGRAIRGVGGTSSATGRRRGQPKAEGPPRGCRRPGRRARVRPEPGPGGPELPGGLRGLVTRHRHRDGTRHSSSLGFGTWTGRTLTTRSDREGKLCRHQRDGAGASDTSAAGAVGPATEPEFAVNCV